MKKLHSNGFSILILLIVIVLIGLVGAGWFFINQAGDVEEGAEQQTTSTTENKSTVESAGSVTINELGLSFQYPAPSQFSYKMVTENNRQRIVIADKRATDMDSNCGLDKQGYMSIEQSMDGTPISQSGEVVAFESITLPKKKVSNT